MRHAREDYDHIQDPTGKIPEDEPVFIVRGQDRAAVSTMLHWCQEAESLGASREIVETVRAWAGVVEDWQREHGDKVPDMPAGAGRAREMES